MTNYIIKNNTNDKFIGIDSSSGGYPYDTNVLEGARIWVSKEAAYEYYKTFNDVDWSLHIVNVETKPCDWQ